MANYNYEKDVIRFFGSKLVEKLEDPIEEYSLNLEERLVDRIKYLNASFKRDQAEVEHNISLGEMYWSCYKAAGRFLAKVIGLTDDKCEEIKDLAYILFEYMSEGRINSTFVKDMYEFAQTAEGDSRMLREWGE